MTGILVARPKKDPGAGAHGTKHVRVYLDLWQMISDILLVEPELRSAGLLDPMLRPGIVAMWTERRPRIEAARRARKGR